MDGMRLMVREEGGRRSGRKMGKDVEDESEEGTEEVQDQTRIGSEGNLVEARPCIQPYNWLPPMSLLSGWLVPEMLGVVRYTYVTVQERQFIAWTVTLVLL